MSWIDQRSSGVPPRLRARIADALGDTLPRGEGQATAACIDAAVALLRDLLARESTGRDLALDLLTVDALATYAFEAAADDPSTLKTYAAAAAARFAAAGAA
jgi:hypothetical protein